jgi:hypothetical protein
VQSLELIIVEKLMKKNLKYNFLIFLFVLCFGNLIYSQEINDEANNEIKYTKSMIKGSSGELLDCARRFLNAGDIKHAIFFGEQSYAKSKSIENKISALFFIAYIYEKTNDINRAKFLYRQIIRNFPSYERYVRIAKERLVRL